MLIINILQVKKSRVKKYQTGTFFSKIALWVWKINYVRGKYWTFLEGC
jgi:hypothetical protein